jgi:hypothetical protein
MTHAGSTECGVVFSEAGRRDGCFRNTCQLPMTPCQAATPSRQESLSMTTNIGPRTLRFSLAFLSLPLACGSHKSEPTSEISFGVVLDRTSQSGGLIAIPDIVQIAIDDVNAGIQKAGGFKGMGFTHTDGDSAGAPATGARLAAMQAQSGVKLIIVDNSANTVAVMKNEYDADTTNDMGVPTLCVLCSAASINDPAVVDADPTTQMALRNGLKWNYRVIMASKYAAPIIVSRALAVTGTDRNGDGVLKVSAYASNEPQGQGAVRGFEAALKAMRPDVFLEKIFHDPAADPNGSLWASDAMLLADNRNETSSMVDGVPDVVFESSLPGTAIAITRAFIQGGYSIPLVHGAPFGNETAIIDLGQLANGQEGVGYTTYFPGTSGSYFAQRYSAHFGSMPQSHERDGATTYDAVLLGALATMTAARNLTDPLTVTGAEVRDALAMINDPAGTVIHAGPDEIAKAIPLIAAGMPINYEGASGPLDFDASGFVTGAMAHWKIENNRFQDSEIYDCTKGAACPLVTTPSP